jgi:hypothetical protein
MPDNCAVLPYHGLYLGFPTVFNPMGAIPPPDTNFSRINQIELAVSRDVIGGGFASWERVAEREVMIPIAPWDGVAIDTNQVLPAGPPVVRPDTGEVWVYYCGHRFAGFSAADHVKYDGGKELFRLGVDPVVDWRDNAALCLAKLRPEGFCSLEAGVQGTFLTKPFLWPRGKALWLNCESHFGEIYCEVGKTPSWPRSWANCSLKYRCTPTGMCWPTCVFWVNLTPFSLQVADVETGVKPLLGFGRRLGGPITGDHPQGTKVEWLGAPQAGWGEPVRLKVYMVQARVYSFWLADEDT